MERQVGRVSLGLLCLVAGGLWLVYKFEYLQLLLGAFSRRAETGFDVVAEQRILLFILSPGLVLILAGLAMIVWWLFHRGPRSTGRPLTT